jgi:membrane protein YqaA with SNARE-associated domain
MTKGLVWLGVIVAMYVFTRHTIDKEVWVRFEPLFRKSWLVFSIFCMSEVIIGIIPPEVFIIWALRNDTLTGFILHTIVFALISYGAGIMAFSIGKYLHRTWLYQRLKQKYLQKSEKLLKKYGQYLMLVAALTPVPFSGTAMLVGAVNYPFKNYLLISLSRFLKFALSAWVLWHAKLI